MPVALILITLVVVLIDLRRHDGMPASERYRQKFMRDC